MPNKIKADLSVLLNENLESYYWIGFIYADGHIYKEKKIDVTLNCKDLNHLEKLSKYIKRQIPIKKQKVIKLTVQDEKNVKLIIEKFNFKPRKTYNPPSVDVFNKMTDDQFLAFFAGYFDGDGTVWENPKNKCMNFFIVSYHTWDLVFDYWFNRIQNIFNYKVINTTKYNKKTCCFLKFTDKYLVGLIKKKIVSFNLPLMQRKWDRIDEDYTGKRQIASKNREVIKSLNDTGLNAGAISKILNKPIRNIYKALKIIKDGGLKNDYQKQ